MHGVVKPNPKCVLTISSYLAILCELNNIKAAISHPGWKVATVDELTALHQNETW